MRGAGHVEKEDTGWLNMPKQRGLDINEVEIIFQVEARTTYHAPICDFFTLATAFCFL